MIHRTVTPLGVFWQTCPFSLPILSADIFCDGLFLRVLLSDCADDVGVKNFLLEHGVKQTLLNSPELCDISSQS